MKATKKYFGSVTLRFDTKELEVIDEEVTQKKFADRSDAIRQRYELGKQTEALVKIHQDPEKRQEFESQLSNLISSDKVEQILDGLDENALNGVIFYAKNLKDKKVQQALLSLQQY